MKLYELEYDSGYNTKEINWNPSRDINKLSIYHNHEDAVDEILSLTAISEHYNSKYRGV